jgi:predicted RNA-binding Zn ribbon-like protein
VRGGREGGHCRAEQREAVERLLHGALAAADAETNHLRADLRDALDAQAAAESKVRPLRLSRSPPLALRPSLPQTCPRCCCLAPR